MIGMYVEHYTIDKLSGKTRKTVFGFPIRFDTNWLVESQRKTRSLKFQI